MISIRETTIPQMFKMNVEGGMTTVNQAGHTVSYSIQTETAKDYSNDSLDAFDTLMLTCANILAKDEMKPKDDGKSAIIFTNPNGVGEMVMAFIAEYIEDGDNANWYFSGTFNPDDIKNIKPENCHNFDQMEKICPFQQMFSISLKTLHNKAVMDYDVINQLTLIAIKCIYDWLDTEAVEGETKSLVIDGCLDWSQERTQEDWEANKITFAIASVEVVKGVKKMAINFGEELKAIAKGNADSI